MQAAILGQKVGMTRVFDEQGVVQPVTVILAGPCTVLQVKTADRDGYEAVQLGFLDAKPHRSTKPMIGHAAKAGTGPKRFVREVRCDGPTDVKQGDVITVELFAEQDVRFVDVVGTTKGCGFAGGMKRHGFGGFPASHGTERKHRAPGSVGGHASDLGTGRIKKGKRMAGQMGNARRTAKAQRLVAVKPEHNLLLVRGSVPGANGGLVLVRKAKTKS